LGSILAGGMMLATACAPVGIESVAGAATTPRLPSPSLSTTPTDSSVVFGDVTLGTYAGPGVNSFDDTYSFNLRNESASTVTVNLSTGVTYSGRGADDYSLVPLSGCPGEATGVITLTPSYQCLLQVYFFPGALGNRSATMKIEASDGTSTTVGLSGTGTIGYYQVDSLGDVAYAGDAAYYGDAGGMPLGSPIVGMAATGDDGGYWLVAADGGVFSYGTAMFLGSAGATHLNRPIVGMAHTADGHGYWLVASDGGIFSYGDAKFYGSTGNIRLNRPVVGMAITPDGRGYWLVASDGGIFSYGDAKFYGSTGNIRLNKPVVGMAATPDGRGYWLVASDGGIFAYGDARFHGSTGNILLNQPIVGMAAMPTGGGYWFSAADGGLFNYGDAPFMGSGVGIGLANVVGMATDGGSTLQAQNDIPAAVRPHESIVDPGTRGLPRFAGHSG